MSEDHLNHETLKAKLSTLTLHVPHPVLREANNLGEVRRCGGLALTRELQMQGDACLQQRTIVLTDEIPIPIRVAALGDRHDVNVQSGASTRYGDAISLRFDLLGLEVGKRLPQPFG